ncbi:disease resistance protein (TIR-NBS-LRR class) [Trifolium pratense]|uniref:Disease resistance protein (TIR-NBS-LRR class) n=1 Tax=Trifolium pratense TaxID=57577 RepID=A0A2K3NQA4_TRIPR|nr:disease resistance protein (TIR-NBS-LRR class) [Trifolium pratense]
MKNSSPEAVRIHEVFLSFRGGDTRASFTSHLYASLQNVGITVFRDDDSLQRGDHISTSINRAIEESMISIIVFSINYADSRWCLDELVKIMKCHRTIGQVVCPIFYDVDPSEVRHQTVLKFDFPIYELEKRWIGALQEAAGLAGFVVQNFRNESEAIKHIVEKVTHLLEKSDLFVANYPVGVDSRVRDTTQLLDIKQSNDVLLLGMWGMGGIGKTTIAKAIYNKIGRSFNYRSFLANIREVWDQNVGKVSLQEQIIFDICKVTTKIHSIEAGKNILKDRLCRKRVLLVLDDVNTLDQLNALCGSRQWFGPGSRIIITTRDMNILRGNRADQVYMMKEMDENESVELFSWHAFKQVKPKNDFARISKNVVEYSGGLPLALEVLGSYLFDRGMGEWESVLKKLKVIPNDQVQKKLKISYDGLNDDTEKEIFLDVACFFIEMDRNDVILILDGCRLFGEIGISILVERSLVTIDDKNRLGMHDLLRDMGREIIREKSPEELEERCRLWFHEDVLDILSEQTGTKAIKGLTLKLPKANEKCFRTKTFKNMKRLRLLQLARVKLDGDFGYLSRNLRWLSWNGFSSTHIPSNFYRENLVSIELENSNVKFVWKDIQVMVNLKILNLSHSHCLTHSPDFSYMPNLEKLVLADCPRLSEIEKLEEDLEQMESLTTLLANNTAIKRSWMSPTTGFPSMCQTSTIMSSLVPLDIPHGSSHEISSISKYLPCLRSLWVECSSEVQLSHDAAIILDALYATNNKELESAASTSQVSGNSLKSIFIQLGMNCHVANILKEKIVQNMTVDGYGGVLLPSDSYPYWLTFNCRGSSVIFEVPQVEGRNLKTIMCLVFSSTAENIASDGLKNMMVKNFTKATIQLYKREALVSFEDEEGQRLVSSIEPGNKMEVVVVFENNFIVKETSIYLIYDEPIGETMEQSCTTR